MSDSYADGGGIVCDGDVEKDIYRSTHLTFQEFFGSSQCVKDAAAAESIENYFEETCRVAEIITAEITV